MSEPRRIQRKRTRGWRKPEGAIIVDRTSRWGNIFTVADALKDDPTLTPVEARAKCVRMYAYWLNGDVDLPFYEQYRQWILGHLHELAGRDLVCFCAEPAEGEEDQCHAQVLMALAAGRKWVAGDV